MIINSEQLVVLCPLFILLLTVTTILLSISYYRDHFFIFLCSILGLIFSLFSLYIIKNIIPIEITILFHVDKYSLLYISIVILSSIFSCMFSYFQLKNFYGKCEEFYLLLLLSTIGCIVLIISNHMFSLFVGMELIFLPTLGLISYSYDKKYSLEATLKYMILSCSMSVLALFGISLIYSISGSLTFCSLIYELVSSVSHSNSILLCGLGLVILAFLFKLSIFPFHIWIVDVYEGTQSSILMYFSTAIKIAVFSLFFKIFVFLAYFHVEFFNVLLKYLSCLSILFGSIMALFQTNLKRFLGYSSISQFGYVLIPLLSSQNFNFALEATGIYLIGYFLSSVGVFGIMSLLFDSNNKHKCDLIDFYSGLFWKSPILAGIFSVVLFSFSGLPITVGFFGKFYLLSIIIKEHFWFLGIVFCIGSILSIYSYLKIVTRLYVCPGKNVLYREKIIVNVNRKKYVLFLLAISFLILMLGIYPSMIINIISMSEPTLFVKI